MRLLTSARFSTAFPTGIAFSQSRLVRANSESGRMAQAMKWRHKLTTNRLPWHAPRERAKPVTASHPRQKSLRLPQLSELFDWRRSVARVVVVGVGKDDHDALPHLVAKISPTAEFTGAINNGLVPGRRLFFNCLAISEPSDVRPVRSDRIEFQFCR